MKYLFHGDDQLSLRVRKQNIIDEFIQKHPGGQVHAFDFSDRNEEQSIEEALGQGFFNEEKIIICENMSSLFEKNAPRAKEILSSNSPYDILLTENQKLIKANKFLQYVIKNAITVEVFEKKKRNIRELVETLEAHLGLGNLDSNTKRQIEERSADGEEYLQNVQKMLTYANGKKISALEIDALVPVSLETKVFDALDALVSGQKQKAFTLFQILLQKEEVFGILPLCAWQIRQMLLVNEHQELRSKELIAKETGIHPYVVQKILSVLPNFSRARLAKGMRTLSLLDVEIKQGKRTPEGALQHFVFHL